MTLTVELPPELERRLNEEAARLGQAPAEYVLGLVEERLAAPPGTSGEELLPCGVRRRSATELLALAKQQGVKSVERFEDLLGPEEEPGEEPFDVDAFLAARREWYRDENLFPFSDPDERTTDEPGV